MHALHNSSVKIYEQTGVTLGQIFWVTVRVCVERESFRKKYFQVMLHQGEWTVWRIGCTGPAALDFKSHWYSTNLSKIILISWKLIYISISCKYCAIMHSLAGLALQVHLHSMSRLFSLCSWLVYTNVIFFDSLAVILEHFVRPSVRPYMSIIALWRPPDK